MGSHPSAKQGRKAVKSSLKTRIENYILRQTPADIKRVEKTFPNAKKVIGELQAEIRAERKARKSHPKTEDIEGTRTADFEDTGTAVGHPKTGICDGCEKMVPWDELENTRTGYRITMSLCKACRAT